MTTTMSNRKFGIEIECYGTTKEAALAAIREAGVACNIELYGHGTPRDWKIVDDSSLTSINGFEVVSPPLSGIEGLSQVRSVATALVNAGCKVSKECGFHVHVDAAGLSKFELLNVAKRYQNFESQIDQFMPFSRRENRFCRSMNEFFRYDRLDRALCARSIHAALEEFGHAAYDRYFKLNLQAYIRHGTVEFRQHSGTVNATKMANWIVFCTNFVEASKLDGLVPVSTQSAGATRRRRGRPNLIQAKFQVLAELFDHAGVRSTVRTLSIAIALGITTFAVPAYISMFRTKYPTLRHEFRARRGQGYQKLSAVSFRTVVCGTESGNNQQPITTLPVMANDSWDRGLPVEVKSYFDERAPELGTC